MANYNWLDVGVPAEFADAVGRNWIGDQTARHKLRDLLDTYRESKRMKNRVIVLSGPASSGKEFLAACALKHMAQKHNLWPCMVAANALVSHLLGGKSLQVRVTLGMTDLTDPAVEAKCLVVYELGRESEVKVVRDILRGLFYQRKLNCLLTILCTHLSSDDCMERYDLLDVAHVSVSTQKHLEKRSL